MIKLTPQAAAEIRRAAARSNAEGMYLRVTAHRANGTAVVHGMGFDERRDNDSIVDSEGIRIVVNSWHRPLLQGAVLDFVTLNSGDCRFVYANPNDAGCTSFLGVCGGCEEKCRRGVR
ncbi:MAG: hypothetical protein A2045_11260 [Rhodocyclales bacterium GWA2_65_20]|nr:MAG: hypothetical protein A2045_11260 [Rhodocyclales bacterium GWA2_65_20]